MCNTSNPTKLDNVYTVKKMSPFVSLLFVHWPEGQKEVVTASANSKNGFYFYLKDPRLFTEVILKNNHEVLSSTRFVENMYKTVSHFDCMSSVFLKMESQNRYHLLSKMLLHNYQGEHNSISYENNWYTF